MNPRILLVFLWVIFVLVACSGNAATPTPLPATATTAAVAPSATSDNASASPTADTENATPATNGTPDATEAATPAPNTALESALPITQTVTGMATDTALYYSLPITVGGSISATLAADGAASGRTTLELYSQDRLYVQSISVEPGESATLNYIFDHTYTGVALLGVTGSGEFTLTANATPQNDAELGIDSGDRRESGNVIQLGDAMVGQLGDADRADAYLFNISEGGGLLSMTVESGEGPIDASLYNTIDYIGGLTLESTQSASMPTTLTTEDAGQWMLIISSNEVTSYTFNISFTPQDDGASGGDAGGEFESATATEGGEIQGILGNSDTADVYQLSLPPTGAIFTMDLQTSGAEYSAEFYNEAREYVGAVTAGSEPATFTYLYPDGSPEVWYVRVTGNESGSYTLTTSATAQDDGDSGMDAGVEATVALPVEVGEITGMIGFDDNNDYFALTLTEGATLTITFISDSDTALAIYDATGNYVNTLVVTADTPSATLQIPIDATVSTPYYFDVSKGDGIAAYSLTTEIGN